MAKKGAEEPVSTVHNLYGSDSDSDGDETEHDTRNDCTKYNHQCMANTWRRYESSVEMVLFGYRC